jgi:DNA-3-methyladenine glycosylase
MGERLSAAFFANEDVVFVAKSLLGKVLVSRIEDRLTSGIIVETEAYKAPEDQGSHAYGGRRTKRTEVMYRKGGTAYVYLIYGMYHLFNVVTGPKNVPHAVLIRALQPLEGIEHMLERRSIVQPEHRLTAGPGVLSIAMGIQTELSGLDLLHPDSPIKIEDRLHHFNENDIIASPRVGLGFEGPWAEIPWRFRIKDNPWTSPAP